jgi:hypothetical protein
MTMTDDERKRHETESYDDLDRDYTERENKQKAMVLSIVLAMQDLVKATTTDPKHFVRCDEICDAVISFAFRGRLDLLPPRTGTTSPTVATAVRRT